MQVRHEAEAEAMSKRPRYTRRAPARRPRLPDTFPQCNNTCVNTNRQSRAHHTNPEKTRASDHVLILIYSSSGGNSTSIQAGAYTPVTFRSTHWCSPSSAARQAGRRRQDLAQASPPADGSPRFVTSFQKPFLSSAEDRSICATISTMLPPLSSNLDTKRVLRIQVGQGFPACIHTQSVRATP